MLFFFCFFFFLPVVNFIYPFHWLLKLIPAERNFSMMFSWHITMLAFLFVLYALGSFIIAHKLVGRLFTLGLGFSYDFAIWFFTFLNGDRSDVEWKRKAFILWLLVHEILVDFRGLYPFLDCPSNSWFCPSYIYAFLFWFLWGTVYGHYGR